MEHFQLEYWHWLILGALIIPLEMMTPTLIVIWFAIGAFLTSLILLAYPDITVAEQLIIFMMFSLFSVFLWRFYALRHLNTRKGEGSDLNERTKRLIGRQCMVTENMVDGRGYIKIDQVSWLCESSADHPAGTHVKVVGVDGTLVKVEKV